MVAKSRAQTVSWRLFDFVRKVPERFADASSSYQLLRYNEDYSYLRDPAKRTDYLDPLKLILLDASGCVHLTLGSNIRQRYERYSDFGLGNGSLDGREDGYCLARYLLHSDLHAGEVLRFFFQFRSNTEAGRRDGARSGADRDDL